MCTAMYVLSGTNSFISIACVKLYCFCCDIESARSVKVVAV